MILGVLAGENDQSTRSLLHFDARHRVEVGVLHLRSCQIDQVALESLLIACRPLLLHLRIKEDKSYLPFLLSGTKR
jgi:hypothetical protein